VTTACRGRWPGADFQRSTTSSASRRGPVGFALGGASLAMSSECGDSPMRMRVGSLRPCRHLIPTAGTVTSRLHPHPRALRHQRDRAGCTRSSTTAIGCRCAGSATGFVYSPARLRLEWPLPIDCRHRDPVARQVVYARWRGGGLRSGRRRHLRRATPARHRHRGDAIRLRPP
jgi:hypothetical protein